MKLVVGRDNVLQMLGLATKAGKLGCGEFVTEKSIKEGKACLVIVATDASENTKKLFRNKCKFYGVPYAEYAIKEQLGTAVGKEDRASVVLLDEGFAKAVIEKLELKNVAVNMEMED